MIVGPDRHIECAQQCVQVALALSPEAIEIRVLVGEPVVDEVESVLGGAAIPKGAHVRSQVFPDSSPLAGPPDQRCQPGDTVESVRASRAIHLWLAPRQRRDTPLHIDAQLSRSHRRLKATESLYEATPESLGSVLCRV